MNTPEERILDAARKMRQAIADSIKESELKRSAAMQDAKTKIERAERIVKETKVDEALCFLFEEMRPYPAWSEREDFQLHKKLNVESSK